MGATCTARSCTQQSPLSFVLINLTGYIFLGGRDFVEGWGGGLAAVIATGFLVWKSQGYWAWMIVNAASGVRSSSRAGCRCSAGCR